jgi:hypothetical protein
MPASAFTIAPAWFIFHGYVKVDARAEFRIFGESGRGRVIFPKPGLKPLEREPL